MEWLEFTVTVPSEYTERAEAIAEMASPHGFYTEDYSELEKDALEIAHIDLIDEELLGKDRAHSVIYLYLDPEGDAKSRADYMTERLREENIPFKCGTGEVKDSDWADNWKKYFKTTPVGERLVIRPVWEEYNGDGERKVLSIDPGAAFGTGTHATTKMCLELLDRTVKDGDTVLDIGCGSGILSVASVLLGAEKGVGVDIDPVAVKVACENAEMNGVGDKTSYEVGDLAEKVSGRFDIVIANIVADIVMRLVPDVGNYMKDDAVFICSGIIDIRKDEVVSCLENNGFTVIRTVNEDNWYAIAAKRG